MNSVAEQHAGASGSRTGIATPPDRARRPAPRRSRFPVLVHATLGAIWIALAVGGSEYYRLDAAARLSHSWHPLLKPSGTIGLAYGYFGSALLLLLLAYSVRKRWRVLAGLGKLRRWLSVHIVCGLLGPGFITLHAGFKFHGIISVGYWAMICVMVSGFIGFYLYSQLPHALAGQADASELLRAEIEALDRELAERFGLGPHDLAALRRASGADRAEHLNVLASLGFLLVQDMSAALGLRRLRHTPLHQRGRAELRRLRALVRQRVLVERRRAFLHQTEALFGYWHTVHKPFAIVLYLMMGIHIAVAAWLGYAWVW